MGTFGEKLRKRREQRGLSLDAISTTTKISPRMLRAIEEEHFDQLPGGVFNKGFVRAYARQIGLDEEEAISDYLAALGESQIQSQTILPNFRNTPGSETEAREPARHNSTADVNNLSGKDIHHRGNAGVSRSSPANGAAASPPERRIQTPDRRLQTEARRQEARRSLDREAPSRQPSLRELPPIEAHPNPDRDNQDPDNDVPYSYPSFLNLSSDPRSSHPSSHRHVESATDPTHENSSPRVPWIKLILALLLITLMLALWTFHRRGQSATASLPHPAQQAQTAPTVPAPIPASTKPSAKTRSFTARPSTPSTSQNPPAPASQTSIPQEAPSPDADVNPPVTKRRPHATAPVPLRTFTLLIRANQTCWVSISTDGQPATTETLIAPANTSVRASREITVKARNAAGISFLFNGREIPIRANAGEVRTFTFDATGLRDLAPAQTTNLTR